MTRRQQVVLGVLGALLLATLITLLVRSGDGGDERVTAGSTTTGLLHQETSTTTSTTALAEPTTSTGPPTTALGDPGPGTAPTTAAPAPVVTGQGSVLRPLAAGEVRTQPPGVGCEGLGDAGWQVDECDTVAAKGAQLVWMVQSRVLASGDTARRVYVFRHAGGQQWRLVLRVTDETGSRFAGVGVRVEDVSDDGAPEIAFGFRMVADDALAVDLVEGPGNVAVHRDLALGRARVSIGQLDLWRAVTPGGSTYAHEVIRYQGGAWRMVSSSTVRGSDVPPSQL